MISEKIAMSTTITVRDARIWVHGVDVGVSVGAKDDAVGASDAWTVGKVGGPGEGDEVDRAEVGPKDGRSDGRCDGPMVGDSDPGVGASDWEADGAWVVAAPTLTKATRSRKVP